MLTGAKNRISESPSRGLPGGMRLGSRRVMVLGQVAERTLPPAVRWFAVVTFLCIARSG